MATKIVVDPGGEHLVPFARHRLGILRQRMADLGVDVQQEILHIDGSKTILVRSALNYDFIRITASGYPRVWVAQNGQFSPLQPVTGRYITAISTSTTQDTAKANVFPAGPTSLANNVMALSDSILASSDLARIDGIVRTLRKLIDARLYHVAAKFLANELAKRKVRYINPKTGAITSSFNFNVVNITDIDGAFYCAYHNIDITRDDVGPVIGGGSGGVFVVLGEDYFLSLNSLSDLLQGNTPPESPGLSPLCSPEVTINFSSMFPEGYVFDKTIGSDIGIGPMFRLVKTLVNEPGVSHEQGCGYEGIAYITADTRSEYAKLRISISPEKSFSANVEPYVRQYTEDHLGFNQRQNFNSTPLSGDTFEYSNRVTYTICSVYGALQTLREVRVTSGSTGRFHSDCGLDPGDIHIGLEETLVGADDIGPAIVYKTSVAAGRQSTLYYNGVKVEGVPISSFVNFQQFFGKLHRQYAVQAQETFDGVQVCGLLFACDNFDTGGSHIYREQTILREWRHYLPGPIDGREPYPLFDRDIAQEVLPTHDLLCAFLLPREDGSIEGVCYTAIITSSASFLGKRASYLTAVYGGADDDEIAEARAALRAEYTVLLNNFASLDLMDLGVPGACLVVLP